MMALPTSILVYVYIIHVRQFKYGVLTIDDDRVFVNINREPC